MKLGVGLLVVLTGACQPKPAADDLVLRARFGVFFGGQIQDRQELPFEVDQTKQSVGIRIDFRAPLSRPVDVAWEIARPLSSRAASTDAGSERVVEVGQVRARLGESRLDVPILLRQGQVLGVWHVGVKVEGRSVIDRDVLVFDARSRRDRNADVGH